jgi:hypothetical protein
VLIGQYVDINVVYIYINKIENKKEYKDIIIYKWHLFPIL